MPLFPTQYNALGIMNNAEATETIQKRQAWCHTPVISDSEGLEEFGGKSGLHR